MDSPLWVWRSGWFVLTPPFQVRVLTFLGAALVVLVSRWYCVSCHSQSLANEPPEEAEAAEPAYAPPKLNLNLTCFQDKPKESCQGLSL